MEKIILYYLFTPLQDPEAVKLWQKTLADSLGLRGRIIISKDGINGTLGGDLSLLKKYIKETKSYPSFKKIIFKWSEGQATDFPKLSVKIRDELVTFQATEELQVDDHGVVGGGKHLKPEQVHELVENFGDEVVFFDGRNLYEAKVGRFKNAVTPNTRTAKDFIPIIESGVYDNLKDKKVVTYCTGGIRCEILTSVMKNRGFEDVYQLDGGIVKYLEKYPKGFFEGSLFVFDKRLGVKYDKDASDVGQCIHCQKSTSNYLNCELKSCNDLVLICQACATQKDNLFHSKECYTLATQ